MILNQLTFDSRSLPEGEAFDAYHAMYQIGTDVGRAPGAFHASVAARRYPELLVFDRTLSGLDHERTRQRVAGDGFDHTTVQLVLSGRLGVTIGDERKWVRAGEMVAFDMRRPQRTWTDGVRQITVSLARDRLGDALPAAADFHGRVFAGEAMLILRQNIRLLAGCDGTTEPTIAEAVAASLGTTIGTMLGAGAPRLRAEALGEIRLRRVVSFIRANLARNDLSAELIADRIGVSRSVLYRMFEIDGGVLRSIKRERLQAARRALATPGEARSISRVMRDCGFASDAHANRSFRNEFGTTPGAYRAICSEAEATSRFSHWFDDFLEGVDNHLSVARPTNTVATLKTAREVGRGGSRKTRVRS